MEAIIGGLGMLGMLVSVGMSGKDSLTQTQTIQNSINAMTQKIADVSTKYGAILKADSESIETLRGELNDDIQSITLLSESIEVARQKHAVSYRAIQMAGIVLVCTIAFVFILKLFGFYDIILETLEFPFKNLFTKKN